MTTLTTSLITDTWTYDESMDQYWMETSTHGVLVYLPEENEFIINEGTNKEYTSTITEVATILGYEVNPEQTNTATIQPVTTELSGNELTKYISNYEQYRNIYMNFKVDNNKVWGLPEGDRTQYYMNEEAIESYSNFLNAAIKYYEGLVSFFNNHIDYNKKLKKYNMYKKRLNNALNKLNQTA